MEANRYFTPNSIRHTHILHQQNLEMKIASFIPPAGMLIGLIFTVTDAFCQSNANAKKGPGNSLVITFNDSDQKWPELIATGKTTVLTTWTCKATRNPKMKVSPDLRYEERIEMADGDTVSSRKLVPEAMAGMVQCETHQLELSVSGPGTLKAK